MSKQKPHNYIARAVDRLLGRQREMERKMDQVLEEVRKWDKCPAEGSGKGRR